MKTQKIQELDQFTGQPEITEELQNHANEVMGNILDDFQDIDNPVLMNKTMELLTDAFRDMLVNAKKDYVKERNEIIEQLQDSISGMSLQELRTAKNKF